MKTEAQYQLLSKAYRTEVRWRILLFSPFVVAAGIIFSELGRSVSDHSLLAWIGNMLGFVAAFGLYRYFIKSKESLAQKLELICPRCSHAIRPDDFKLYSTPDNCPYCRSRLFS